MLDLTWITDGLAIGGSVPPPQIPALARERISAVVDMRGEGCDDPMLLARHQIELLHLPTIDFWPVSPTMLHRGLTFVTDHLAGGRRVLVHCACGIGRSAMLALCVLVEHGYTPLDALLLTKQRRACVSPSPAQFTAWVAWLTARRSERRATWSIPTFDEFKAIAYRHVRRAGVR